MSTTRARDVAVVVGSDSILLLGGDTIEEYHPSTNSWQICEWSLPGNIVLFFDGGFSAFYDHVIGILVLVARYGGSTHIFSRSQPFQFSEWIESMVPVVVMCKTLLYDEILSLPSLQVSIIHQSLSFSECSNNS